MSKGKYPAIFIEGLDGVGKNFLLQSIAKYVLLANPERKVLIMNFPQYWLFGHDIRQIMRGKVDDILGLHSGYDELRFRAFLYGIDRALAVTLAEIYLRKNPDTFVISDRGPFSSCVTAGYVWSQGKISEGEIAERVIPQVFKEADAAMFDFFDVNSLLCAISGGIEDSELGIRKSLDKYEQDIVQRHAAYVYDIAKLPTVKKKVNGEWVSNLEQTKDALCKTGFASIASKEIDKKLFESEDYLYEAYKKDRAQLVGPELFLETTNGEDKISKNIHSKIDKWMHLSLSVKGKYNGNRKEILDILETEISVGIKKKISHLSTEILSESRAVKFLRHSFVEYPFIYDVLRRTSGEAMITFFEALLASDQLTLI